MDRHDTTAKHLAWSGALIGGALAVIWPPAALGALAGVGASGGVLAGAGGIVGHFWNNIPKDDLRRMGDLLESGEAGLLIVAVDPKGTDIVPLLQNATGKVVVTTTGGDVEDVYLEAVAQVES